MALGRKRQHERHRPSLPLRLLAERGQRFPHGRQKRCHDADLSTFFSRMTVWTRRSTLPWQGRLVCTP
jgi:hypothetical protein